MLEREYLLMVLMEECAEVTQRASKAIRFGEGEVQPGQPDDNRRRLERELADLRAVEQLLGLRVRQEDIDAKKVRVAQYLEYSRECGVVGRDSGAGES